MPFTASHPAAVLLMRRSGLPMSALVVGSMVPDLPLFGLAPWSYLYSHSLVGVLTVDLAAGLVLTVAWLCLVRDAVVDLGPVMVRRRVDDHVMISTRLVLLSVLAVVVGALTHVVWDAFTHEGRWGPRHVPWLAQMHGPLTGYGWAQYASGALGAMVIVICWYRWMSSRTVRMDRPRVTCRVRIVLRLTAALGLVAVGIAGLASLGGGVHAAAYAALYESGPWATAFAAAAVLAWHAVTLRTRRYG
jgi:hypothetical protein